MGTESGTPPPDLEPNKWEQALEENPEAFTFFQAVRLLQRGLSEQSMVGEFAHPSEEALRFTVNSSLAFPVGDIRDIRFDEDGPATLSVNFMGLVGHMGVLPMHYTLLIDQQAEAAGDPEAYRDFLDIFQHRMISLFYKAWERSHFYVPFERGEEDRISARLLDFMGLGSLDLGQKMNDRLQTLLFYCGLMGLRQRSAVAFDQLLEDYFDVPVEVEQFRGGWYRLSESSQCRIDDEDGLGAGLGEGTVVGDEIWDPQAKVRIRLGPLSRDQYDDFLPGGLAHQALREMTQLFSDGQFDVEVQLILDKNDVPGVVLGSEEKGLPPLGWSTWLRTKTPTRDGDETILSI
jgi:type VI secretion system protein ImpH